MPNRPPTICAHPGCHKHTTQGRCDEHRREQRREYDRQRVRPHWHLYNDRRWRGKHGLKRRVLNEEPICQAPGCERPSSEVDHIVPHNGDERLFFDRANLQGLCETCHSQKTRRGE